MRLFGEKYPTIIPTACHGLDERILDSKEIVDRAIREKDPYAICLMLSGGDDSVTALQVAVMLGIKIDFIIHGVTGTGLPIVRKFVKALAEKKGIVLLEANAGTAFEDYVLRKGFFGRGGQAHKFSYHLLKANPFKRTITKYLRKGLRGRPVILLNGVRVDESDNRMDNFGDNPYRMDDRNNYWVNIIHWWSKKESLQLLEAEGIGRNPVSIALGRSGECNCGTAQSLADIFQAGELYPEWGKWMTALRKTVVAKHGWDIGQTPDKKVLADIKTANILLSDNMPMCVGCKARAGRLFE